MSRPTSPRGYTVVLAGEGDVVSGWKNKIQSSLANVTPAETLARQHRKMAEPGTADPGESAVATAVEEAVQPSFT